MELMVHDEMENQYICAVKREVNEVGQRKEKGKKVTVMIV